MPVFGSLTRDNIGFSMPAHAPLFNEPPYAYANASLLVFWYLTDPVSAARMLPAQASMDENQPVAGLVFADYPESTLGPYREAVQFLVCDYEGKKGVKFATHLYVTTDVAMAAGREMGGYPKKIAAITVPDDCDSPMSASLARPADLPLASATFHAYGVEKPLPEELSVLHYLTLRLIPSATEKAPPTVSELMLSRWEIHDGKIIEGTGECRLTAGSTHDPLHFAPVVEVVKAAFIRGNLRVSANPAGSEPPKPL